MKIIITPDDHKVNKDQYAFLVYDLCDKSIYKHKKSKELICDEDKGRGFFRPFGIEVKDNIYIASNTKLAEYDLYNYQYIKNIDYPLFANTHQIIKSGDTFYVCNTAINTIGIYGKEINHFNVISKTIDNNVKQFENCEEQDLVHLNSLYEHNQYIYYCLHYLNKKQSEFWRLDKQTLIAEYLVDAGHSCHNIEIINDLMFSLSSDTGEIVIYNLSTKKLKYYLAVNSDIPFLRGLAKHEGKLYFGASNNFNNTPLIKENCNIYTYDSANDNIEHVLYLEDVYTITDLKLIT